MMCEMCICLEYSAMRCTTDRVRLPPAMALHCPVRAAVRAGILRRKHQGRLKDKSSPPCLLSSHATYPGLVRLEGQPTK